MRRRPPKTHSPRRERAAGHAGCSSPEGLGSRSGASPPARALHPAMPQGPPVTTSRPRCRPCRRLQPHLHVTADRNMATVPPEDSVTGPKFQQQTTASGAQACSGKGCPEVLRSHAPYINLRAEPASYLWSLQCRCLLCGLGVWSPFHFWRRPLLSLGVRAPDLTPTSGSELDVFHTCFTK